MMNTPKDMLFCAATALEILNSINLRIDSDREKWRQFDRTHKHRKTKRPIQLDLPGVPQPQTTYMVNPRPKQPPRQNPPPDTRNLLPPF